MISVSADATVTISAGGSSIEVGPGGVKISGAIVEVAGGMIKHNG